MKREVKANWVALESPVSNTEHVFCPKCKLQITGPFRSTGYSSDEMLGECSGAKGCGAVVIFLLCKDENE